MQATAIILAAGLGTRTKSALPKTLHRPAGRSMLRHLLASCETVFDRIVVVRGPDRDVVRREAEPHLCVVQHERLGTAHAALPAAEDFGDASVGSGTKALVAPVSVGDGAVIGAGSVTTENVAPDALALARERQVQKPGRAPLMREAAQKLTASMREAANKGNS
jgi:bifunctional N-acetylglucosamine-1-phosphate-uridyltransferase/glucosamine-1-phosphate-acetyltransferase GlmU-like protein